MNICKSIVRATIIVGAYFFVSMTAATVSAAVIDAPFPSTHIGLKKTISFDEMESFLESVEKLGFITVTKEGESAGGRPIYLIRLCRGGVKATFKAFFYAQQHGDEVSGKDAQLYLIRRIAENPSLLPEDIDLYLMPTVNPDGAVAYRRANGAGADLNRDHMTLHQPETQTLYKVARRIMPHLAVDCHEYTRDGRAVSKRGWEKWPLIAMDVMNHLIIPDYLIEAGMQILNSASDVMQKAGHSYARYMVGGPPPDEEIRPSTTEVDDGRNGMGGHCALSFIIEAAVSRKETAHSQDDLGARIDAYLALYWHLLGTKESRSNIISLVDKARRETLPPFISTNFFWANLNGKVSNIKVIEAATGKTLEIPTANVMPDMVSKNSVPTPKCYVIEASASVVFRPLLDSHGLQYRVTDKTEHFDVEPCRLIRIEEPFDDVYQRYENRVIVEREPIKRQEFGVGSIIVPLDQPLARRALQILEPCMFHGLYGYPAFRPFAKENMNLPVYRVLK